MDEVSLYIHVPFCASKCMYCDFPSFCGKESLMLDYAKALSSEIDKRTQGKIIKTIFIGGGTPTYLSLEAWEIIKGSLDKLNKVPEAEFTVECNPGTIAEEKLLLFKEIGINRLSIGLQAWQDELLRSIGRRHTLPQFLSGFEMARKSGFDNINIDLMFGLPNQTVQQWEETLKGALGMKPEHVSCYSLIIEEGTPFYGLQEKSKLDLPNEEDERQMYHAAVRILAEDGYGQYEISNFSRPGRQCRHNIVYWKLEEYIGCGAAAHSYLEGKRYRNEENIEKYISKMYSTGCSNVEILHNSSKDDMEEFMFMGLRMKEGVSRGEFADRFGREISEVYGSVILKHERNGLIKMNKNSIFLTPKGIELSNTVMSDFLL
jgi:oxygen-independent coproporphyrinogen III oxidase